MAWTADTTGAAQTVASASEVRFFTPTSDNLHCTTLKVRVRSGAPVVIRVPELHGASGGWPMDIGDVQEFRFGHDGVSEAYVTGNGAVLDWAPIAGGTS